MHGTTWQGKTLWERSPWGSIDFTIEKLRNPKNKEKDTVVRTHWLAEPQEGRSYLTQVLDRRQIASMIERLIVQPPRHHAGDHARYWVATLDEDRTLTRKAPPGLLPGWDAVSLLPGEEQNGARLCWPDDTAISYGQEARLRIAVAVDDREARTVDALFGDSEVVAGRFDIRFAAPFQSSSSPCRPRQQSGRSARVFGCD